MAVPSFFAQTGSPAPTPRVAAQEQRGARSMFSSSSNSSSSSSSGAAPGGAAELTEHLPRGSLAGASAFGGGGGFGAADGGAAGAAASSGWQLGPRPAAAGRSSLESPARHSDANMVRGNAPMMHDLPPSVSLLSMDRADHPVQQESGLRNRRSHARSGGDGLDIGAPRGLDLDAPLKLNPGQDRLGVTAAVELIDVNSPWITVFGYPAGSGFDILRYFQSFGEVHEHRQAGNWMHILYGSKVQASRALAQNGALVDLGGGKVMIGVKSGAPGMHASVNGVPQPTSTLGAARGGRHLESRGPPNSMCKRFWAWVMDV